MLANLLNKIPFWRDLPYPTKSALDRAVRAALAVLFSTLLAAATAGILFPATASPLVVLVLTAIIQSVDKFLRETNAAKDAIAAGAVNVGTNRFPAVDGPAT